MAPLYQDAFKSEKFSGGTYMSYAYPKLPYNIDFETYRKTDPQWKKIVAMRNAPATSFGIVHEPDSHSERFIVSRWPRDPDGQVLSATPVGKVTPNGYPLWGATLYDFYMVHRHPQFPAMETISTGSKLAAWMKQIGELNAAPDALDQAEREDEPYQLQVFDIGQYIEVLEEQVWKGKVGKPMQIDRDDSKAGSDLLFAPSDYPAPWPLLPFSAPLARLQKKIPLSSLPRKLIVHDPWNVLCVNPERRVDRTTCKWGTNPDIIRTYFLELGEGAHNGQESKGNETHHVEAEGCPVAHLYITPRRRIGAGHHSFVYQVELELPRTMLVQPKICYKCTQQTITHARNVLNGVSQGIQELKGIEDDVRSLEDKTKGMSREEVLKLVPGIELANDQTMQQNYSRLFKEGRPFEEKEREDPLFRMIQFAKAQKHPPYCGHLERGIPTPPSHRVSVIAKLSLPNDEDMDYYYDEDDKHDTIHEHLRHLRREAENYQNFPSPLFEHWNGYNVIHPMHDPTPVGAVVPQFYGFYVPDKSEVKEGQYMSPLLLLEHCGVQVDPTNLPIDDRRECFSLIRRLHVAGYVHRSVYQRNFVMQYGPLQESPFKRSKLHPRFRLIDFGRSYKCDQSKAFREQSDEADNARENLHINSI